MSTISINGLGISSANFNDTTPTSTTNSTNVKWQVASPGDVSAEVPFSINPSTAQITIAGSTLTNLHAIQGLNSQTFGDGTFGPFIVVPTGGSVALYDNASGTQWRLGGVSLNSVQGAPLTFRSPANVGLSPLGAGELAIGNGTSSDASGKLTLAHIKATGLIVYASNAAAIAGGLSVGDFYRTGSDPDLVAVVH